MTLALKQIMVTIPPEDLTGVVGAVIAPLSILPALPGPISISIFGVRLVDKDLTPLTGTLTKPATISIQVPQGDSAVLLTRKDSKWETVPLQIQGQVATLQTSDLSPIWALVLVMGIPGIGFPQAQMLIPLLTTLLQLFSLVYRG